MTQEEIADVVARSRRKARARIDAATPEGAAGFAQMLDDTRGKWFVDVSRRVVWNDSAQEMLRAHVAYLAAEWSAADLAVKNLRHRGPGANVAA